MSRQSIDGLRRRKTSKEILVTRVSPRSNILGAKKPKTPVATAPIKPKDVPKKTTSVERPVEKRQYSKELEDFLSEIRNDDPTVLVTLDEKSEEELRKQGRKEKAAKKPKKPRKKLRKFLLGLGIFFILIVAALVWLYVQGNDLVAKITGGGNLWELIVADPNTPLESDPKSGRTNVLLFGTSGYDMDNTNHDGGWLTDTIMIASLDQESGDIKTVSLPRDLKINTCTSTNKINEIYYCNYSKNDGSEESRQKYEKVAAEALKTEVEELLDISIQYYAHVNWQALVQVIDAIGGIDVAFVYKGDEWSGEEVAIETTDKRGLADIYDKSCKCYLVKYDSNKSYHLNGAQALGVARARNDFGGWGAAGGNFSREQFQQKILQAVIVKAKQTNFATDLMAVLKIKDAVGDNVRMNFKDSEFKTILSLSGKIDLGNMETISLQNTDDGTSLFSDGLLPVPGVNNLECGGSRPGCISYVFPKAGVSNYSEIQKYIKKKFNGESATENVSISVMNATTTSGLAAKEKEKLEEKGLYVYEAVNAPANLSVKKQFTIFKISDGDYPNTVKQLEKIYDVKITTEIPASLKNNDNDFVIVIGPGS